MFVNNDVVSEHDGRNSLVVRARKMLNQQVDCDAAQEEEAKRQKRLQVQRYVFSQLEMMTNVFTTGEVLQLRI